MFHKARNSDRISRVSLVTSGYLAPPVAIGGPLQLDYDHRRQE